MLFYVHFIKVATTKTTAFRTSNKPASLRHTLHNMESHTTTYI